MMNKHFPKPQNQRKDIYILRDQLLGDIEVQLQIVAESRVGENGLPLPILDNALSRFGAQFVRFIDKYIDLAKARMAAYLVTPHVNGEMNAHREWREQKISLSFPWYWNATTFPQLCDAIHDYIVNGALYEFFLLTLTSKDAVTADKQVLMLDAYSMIKHCCVSSLPGTQRKTLQPF